MTIRLGVLCFAALIVSCTLCRSEAQSAISWDTPAATLAGRIADILGPGPASLSIRNLSSIPSDQLPAIRKIVEGNLKSHGVNAGGADSANNVRITLSENALERLWVAEVIEGNETRVVMVELAPPDIQTAKSQGTFTLSRQILVSTRETMLAALEVPAGILILEPERVVLYVKENGTWQERGHEQISVTRSLGRDPRGDLFYTNDGLFDAWLPGVHCSGSITTSESHVLSLSCSPGDDPWAVTQMQLASDNAESVNGKSGLKMNPIRAFYNAARNSFTGVLVPGTSQDMPPFYSIALLARTSGYGLLTESVDGKVQLSENGAVHSITGTRDWGSDFAALQSGCRPGTQIVVSGSGDAAADSLRAYELPLFEAVPASEPLGADGSVIAISSATDFKSVLAIVKHASHIYEVNRVTAICN